MRKLNSQSELVDLPGDLRVVVEECLQRWEDSGVLYDPLDEAVILVEPGDSIETLIEYSSALLLLRDNRDMPTFEWVVDYECCYEAGLILGDDGSGFSLIVPKAPGIPAPLIDACILLAESAPVDD
jgi:hypothetical protein